MFSLLNCISCSPDEQKGRIELKRNADPAVACPNENKLVSLVLNHMSEERQLKVMRLLENSPEMTQRDLASTLGISLGAVNFCLKALVDKGWIKIDNFNKNPNKLGYLYLVTPKGIAAKTKLTLQCLKRKLIEYDELKTEIETLEKELLH